MALQSIEFLPGKLIYLEGVDGAGKTVNSQWLVANSNARYTREPGSSPISEVIREIVKDPMLPLTPEQQAALFMASRGLYRLNSLEPALDNGETYVGDRSWLSTAVYQGNDGIDVDLIYLWAREAMGRLQFPDLMIVLDQEADISPARLEERGTNTNDRDKTKGLEYTRAIVEGYRTEVRKWQDLGHNIVSIDSSRTLPEVRRDILKACSHLMLSQLTDESVELLIAV